MKFPPLIPVTIIKRYKRFLVDVQLDDKVETAHCPNSGSMKTCLEPSWKGLVSYHPDPKRKLKYTLQLVHNGNCWICVNTHLANEIVYEGLLLKQIPELNCQKISREVSVLNSRIDFFLDEHCFLEVKSVTLKQDATYQFPDSVTTRGQKHLEDLMALKKQGYRAVLLFVVLRSDGETFTPAVAIDPAYSLLLKEAHKQGVEILAYGTLLSSHEAKIHQPIPLFF